MELVFLDVWTFVEQAVVEVKTTGKKGMYKGDTCTCGGVSSNSEKIS